MGILTRPLYSHAFPTHEGALAFAEASFTLTLII